ncbi:copper amine oxidase N-terminal domain-containing protein [Paenibacillus sp. ATY16]|uniref:copper amine oxidase N-terminal domain-containing protein n=1 Tax=Paenibacillus sp. ATY16 TaxID=1759312 RepID=UPI00200F5491|nr:copper amine oxidase N-terminal domain-containing protein [Paenibacillus sp. ATY16]
MKKIVFAFAIIVMMCFSSSAVAADKISIMVKNKQIQTDSAPVVVQGKVLIPLRAVSESLGAIVEWNQQQKTAVVSKWSKKASLTVGKKTARVENLAAPELSADKSLDVSVQLISSRVYVPLRFISEQLGYTVDYKNNIVSIRSPYEGLPKENFFAQILSGDLGRSRSIITANNSAYGLRNYELPPLKTGAFVANEAYLFPEGEALRFFMIEDNEIITYYEYKDDFLVATWQGRLEDKAGNAIDQLYADKFKERTGPTPKINKPFFYRYYSGYENSVWRCGRIDVDGKFTETGFKDETQSIGMISFVFPNEIRKEVIPVSQTSLRIP